MFKVLKDWKGSPDGFTVIEYKTGQIVELHPTLVDVALGEKWVERVATDASVYTMALKGWAGESPSKPASSEHVSRPRRKK